MRAGTWGSILMIYLFGVLAGASIGKVIPLVPDIANSLQVSVDSVSWVISLIAGVSVILAPAGGMLSDYFGDRRLIAGGVLILILGNALDAVAPSFYALLAARMVEGTGFIAISLGMTAIMIRTTSGPRQAQAMSLLSTAVPFGIGIALALSGLAAGEDWRNVFWAHGAALACALPIVLLLPAWEQVPQADGEAIGWLSIVTTPGPMRLCVGIGVATIALFGMGTLFPIFLMQVHNLPPVEAAAFGAISYPASAFGSFLLAWLVSRSTSFRALTLGSFTVLVLTGGAVYFPVLGVSVSAAVMVVFYVAGGMVGALALARLPDVVPTPAALGVTSGLFMQMANAGILLGAPVNFYFYKNGGAVGMAALTLACAAVTVWLWAFRPKAAALAT